MAWPWGAYLGAGGQDEGVRGPVTELIQRAFFDATSGRDGRYSHWLRHVAAQPAWSSF
jgi:hypothetical protein